MVIEVVVNVEVELVSVYVWWDVVLSVVVCGVVEEVSVDDDRVAVVVSVELNVEVWVDVVSVVLVEKVVSV